MYQPGSRTMFSLTIPASASRPDSTRSAASVSWSPWSYGLAASAASARSTSASTIQTSSDSWSRTPCAARDSDPIAWAAVPVRCRSSSIARSSGIIVAAGSRKPGYAVLTWVIACSSTSSALPWAMSTSVSRATVRVARISRSRSSARSA